MTNSDRDKTLYKTFQDWRIRLFDRLDRIDLGMLKTLRAEMLQAIEDIDQEIERRGKAKS